MRFSYRAAGLIAAAVTLTLLSACSRTQDDWRVAQKADTAQAYQVFLDRHSDSELAAVARQRIAQLTEEAAWQRATHTNTAAAYQDYLAKYPNGSWSQDARIRMQSRSLARQEAHEADAAVGTGPEPPDAPGLPAGGGSSDAQPTVSTAPSSSGAASIGPAVAVQLGAYSSVANAHAAWTQLSTKFGPELRGLSPLVVPVMVSGRRLYRLQARVASRATAHRLCQQLQQRSQGCRPVP